LHLPAQAKVGSEVLKVLDRIEFVAALQISACQSCIDQSQFITDYSKLDDTMRQDALTNVPGASTLAGLAQ
jgi:hypothetical protein